MLPGPNGRIGREEEAEHFPFFGRPAYAGPTAASVTLDPLPFREWGRLRLLVLGESKDITPSSDPTGHLSLGGRQGVKKCFPRQKTLGGRSGLMEGGAARAAPLRPYRATSPLGARQGVKEMFPKAENSRGSRE